MVYSITYKCTVILIATNIWTLLPIFACFICCGLFGNSSSKYKDRNFLHPLKVLQLHVLNTNPIQRHAISLRPQFTELMRNLTEIDCCLIYIECGQEGFTTFQSLSVLGISIMSKVMHPYPPEATELLSKFFRCMLVRTLFYCCDNFVWRNEASVSYLLTTVHEEYLYSMPFP